jgi:copper chaperone CopZ
MKDLKIEEQNKHCKLRISTRITEVKGRTSTRIKIPSKKAQRNIKRMVNLQRMMVMEKERNQ